MNPDRPARPFLKWAGGKTKLLGEILSRLPRHIETYYEPFLGGGAVFFALAAEGRIERAVLSDANDDLIAAYTGLKENVDGVIAELKHLPYDEEEFYRVRAARPKSLVKRAARIIYLNKTGYNGLYRVNRSGQFNVPFGRHLRPNICDEPNLREVARVLQSAELRISDFEAVCAQAQPGDAVYLDPPYVPVSRTANFSDYDHHPFREPEHERLALALRDLAKRRVSAVLSNSDTEQTRRLYQGLCVETVMAARAINSNPQRRGPVSELIVSARRRRSIG